MNTDRNLLIGVFALGLILALSYLFVCTTYVKPEPEVQVEVQLPTSNPVGVWVPIVNPLDVPHMVSDIPPLYRAEAGDGVVCYLSARSSSTALQCLKLTE